MTIAIIVILVVVVALMGFAATKPNEFRVERSAQINAPPETIFPHINDFHRWSDWSPYERHDPAMKKTFSGAPLGQGAVYEWDGNNKVGKGRMEIIQSSPPNQVVLKLDFLKPFEGHNTGAFTIEPVGDATRVTWAIEGPSAFAHKFMGIFMNMDNMIARDFEVGLANLKSITEG